MTRPFIVQWRESVSRGAYVVITDVTGLIEYSDLLPSDRVLWIMNCNQPLDLSLIPAQIRSVRLRTCSELTDLRGLGPNVDSLTLTKCPKLVTLAGLPDHLSMLTLVQLDNLQWRPELLPRELKILSLQCMACVTELSGLPQQLESIEARSLPALTSVGAIPETVTSVALASLERVTDLSVLPDEIEFLRVESCPQVVAVPFRTGLKGLNFDYRQWYPVYTPDGQDVIPDHLVGNIGEYLSLLTEYAAFRDSRKKSAMSTVRNAVS